MVVVLFVDVTDLSAAYTTHFGSAVHVLAFSPLLGGREGRGALQRENISVNRLTIAGTAAATDRVVLCNGYPVGLGLLYMGCMCSTIAIRSFYVSFVWCEYI